MTDPMSGLAPCTMQIPITDSDERYARHILPHQMAVLGRHAADVLISINRQHPPEDPRPLDLLIDRIELEYPNVRRLEVDYGEAAIAWVSDTFFCGREYPLYDFKGIPLHAFLEQYRHSRHRHFFHLAPDMMLGGSGPWFGEAIAFLESHPAVLAINPLGGPRAGGAYQGKGQAIACDVGEAFEMSTFTGRTHLVDLERFLPVVGDLPLIGPPRLMDRLQSRVAGHAMVEHLEILFQHKMQSAQLVRVDMGGSGNLWTLHPVHKTGDFVAGLADLIARVERNEYPADQAGDPNLCQRMLPQTDIPGRKEVMVRLGRQLGTRLAGPTRRRLRRESAE